MISLALWRFLRRTPWSTCMALLGVALGVTSIVSVHLISANVAQQLDSLIPDELAGYSHFLHRDELDVSHYFELRQQWRRAAYASPLRITAVAPLIDETAVVQGQRVRVIGVDLFTPGSVDRLQRSSATEQSFAWRGVWVDRGVRDTSGLTVNGVLDGEAGLIFADIGVAQELLGWGEEDISYIGIQLRGPLAAIKRVGENLLPGFGAGLPAGEFAQQALAEFSPVEFSVLSLAQQHPASQFGKSVLFNISALGLLAMLVAWFLMYQVAVSWLRRLWPVFQRLHVLGVEWRALRVYFVSAMCGLGLLACLVGLQAGVWLAQGLFNAVVDIPHDEFGLSGWVVGKAVLSALGVCLLGGIWAFRQARQAPISGVRVGWSVLLLAAAVVGVSWPQSGLLGGFTSIAVCSLLAALVAAPLLRYLRGKAGLIGGPYLARLSVREAVWYPQDLAVALAGLVLAVATAIGVGLMVDSFRQDFSRMLEQRLSYDLVIRGDAAELSAVQLQLAASPRVHRLQVYRHKDLRLQGVPMQIVSSHYDAAETARYGLSRGLAENEVLLSEQGARALGVGAAEVTTVAGHEVRIAGIFASFGDLQPRLLLPDGHPLAAQMQHIRSISIYTDEPDQLADELLQRFAGLRVDLQRELRQTALATFDQTFVITTVLIFIAMLVAAIGVYVAVTTLRLNRRTSGQLMQGLGLNRVEDVGMDFALGLGVGLVAMVLALPLGTVFGWILCAVINPRAFGWTVELQLSWQAYATPLFWGLMAAVVAGLVRVGRQENGGLRGVA